MKMSEVAELLALAQAADNRNVGRANVEMWHQIITSALGDDVRAEDARTALVDHYASSGDWLMPVHIIRGVKRIWDRRVKFAPTPDVPYDVADDPVAERAWLKAYFDRVKASEIQPVLPGESVDV